MLSPLPDPWDLNPWCPDFDVVVLAASRGGLEALTSVLVTLPENYPLPITIVQHQSPRKPGLLAGLLDRRSRLQVMDAVPGRRLRPGVAYVAPPDQHLLITPRRRVLLSNAPKVNFARPAADTLLRSAAKALGARVLAVILTGGGVDGAAGVHAVKEAGGVIIAQDRATSLDFGMPGAAIETGDVDFILPLSKIPAALISLGMVPGAPALFAVPRSDGRVPA